MDSKRKKRSYKQEEDDDSTVSEDDHHNEQQQRHNEQRHESGEQSRLYQHMRESGGAYYASAHVASVEDELNARAQRHELNARAQRPPPVEQLMPEPGQETRRFAFRRCKKHRREEMLQLDEEMRRLEQESEQLVAEKARLQEELRLEISLASNVTGSTGGAAATNQQVQISQAQQVHQSQLAHMMQHQPRQAMRQFRPTVVAPGEVAYLPYAQVMPPAANHDVAGASARHQNPGSGRGLFPMPRSQGPQQNMIGYLSRLHANHDEAVASLQASQAQSIPPQLRMSPQQRAMMERHRQIEALRSMEASQAFASINSSPKSRPEEPGAKREK